MYTPVTQFETMTRRIEEKAQLAREVELAREAGRARRTHTAARLPFVGRRRSRVVLGRGGI